MIVPESKDGPLTFEDLRCHYQTERSYSSGYGRNKVTRSITYVNTKVGEVEQSKWTELVQKLIQEAGEGRLFAQLLEWVTENTPWLHTEKQRKDHALELHASKIFDDETWVCFVEFNQKYRPERLESVELVRIIPECCGKPAVTTRKQLQRNDGKVCCPHCGRFSEYEEIKKETS